jgi:hypothetical protein
MIHFECCLQHLTILQDELWRKERQVERMRAEINELRGKLEEKNGGVKRSERQVRGGLIADGLKGGLEKKVEEPELKKKKHNKRKWKMNWQQTKERCLKFNPRSNRCPEQGKK